MVWQPAKDELARFMSIFGAPCTATGSVYMTDSWSSRRAELADKMKARQLHMAATQWVSEPARDTRFAALLESVNASSRMHATLYEEKRNASSDPNDPFFADWEQHPQVGKAAHGRHIPCLLTHGTLVEHTSGQSLTCRELLAVQGWGTLRDDAYTSDIMELIVKSCGKKGGSIKNAVKTFVGNSMHIPSVLAVLLYAFSHVQRRSQLEATSKFLSLRSASFCKEMGAGSSGSGSSGIQIQSAQAETPPKSKAKCKAKGQPQNRGQKRQVEADPGDPGDHDGDDSRVLFRRLHSSIFEG